MLANRVEPRYEAGAKVANAWPGVKKHNDNAYFSGTGSDTGKPLKYLSYIALTQRQKSAFQHDDLSMLAGPPIGHMSFDSSKKNDSH